MAETPVPPVSKRFPRLSTILGRSLEAGADGPAGPRAVALWQVERDLEVLARRIPWHEIKRSFRQKLRDAIDGTKARPRGSALVDAMYEIRVGAMLAPVAADLQLEPPVGSGSCDLKCRVGGTDIFVEVTTLEDRMFPADPDAWSMGEEPAVFSRATVERSFDLTTPGGDRNYCYTPASKELRDRITGKVRQLPRGEMTLVVVGNPGGRSLDMEAALLGDEGGLSTRKGAIRERERVLNGLFTVADELGGLSGLSAAVWMKLVPHFPHVRVHSRLFVNLWAARPVPPEVEQELCRVFDRDAWLRRELDRMTPVLVERYKAERIILFGSLADPCRDAVHEWSDIDLAIIKSTPLRFEDRVAEVLDLLEPRVGLNVLVYTPGELAGMERDGNSFVRDEILKKGRQLFP